MKLSSSVLLVLAVTLCLSSACHFSCNCDPNSNVCLSCKDANSVIDQYVRSCPCPSGYYTATLEPFLCQQYIQLDANNTDISVNLTACQIETSAKSQSLQIQTKSKYEIINGNGFVLVDVSLDTTAASLIPECTSEYSLLLKYNNTLTNLLEDFPSQYVLSNTNGTESLKIPLIEFYQLAESTSINVENQIQQTVHFQLIVNNTSGTLREHLFDLIVLTNRNQVQTFTFDVGVQQTEGCSAGSDCIVIADLSTTGNICEDETCTATRANSTYTVGDIFFAKIAFTDPTYTKSLEFISLFLRDDSNIVYNFSEITLATWETDKLLIQLPLVEPTTSALIQVNLQIQNQSVLRRMLGDLPNQSRSIFQAVVLPTNNEQSLNAASILGIFSLMVLALVM